MKVVIKVVPNGCIYITTLMEINLQTRTRFKQHQNYIVDVYKLNP